MPARPPSLLHRPRERRASARKRGYDRRWERVRLMHLAAEPLCRMCAAEGRVTAATLVDHIVPIEDGGAVLADANLQSLCIPCHGIKTADDLARRAGKPVRGCGLDGRPLDPNHPWNAGA